MIDQAIEQLTPAALRQVQRGNSANAIGQVRGRCRCASLDLSGEPSYQKATERPTAAKDNLKKVTERLTTRGKGELKMGATSLRVNLPNHPGRVTYGPPLTTFSSLFQFPSL